MKNSELSTKEYDSYFGRYINKVSRNIHLREGFLIGKKKVVEFFNAIPEDKLNYRYDTDKWTIKEVFQHLIDTERIFALRAFRIARNDKTPLSSFDQNIYVIPSKANNKTRAALIKEYEAVRDSSLSLISSLEEDDLRNIGISSGHPMSARAAAFIILGHEIWHLEIIKERYL